MSVLSVALQDDLLDYLASHYGTLEMGLYTALPDPDDPLVGEANDSTSGGHGYVRQTITLGTASGGVIYNDNAISFTDLWDDPYTHAAIFDGGTDNILVYGNLTVSVTPADLGEVAFAAGEISISIS